MSPEVHSEIEQLKRRLDQLANAPRRTRGRTNQAGAARYLGISEETLRQRHARGEAPRRARSGVRGWTYAYDDLDAYIAEREIA
jgi:hypothetical protein